TPLRPCCRCWSADISSWDSHQRGSASVGENVSVSGPRVAVRGIGLTHFFACVPSARLTPPELAHASRLSYPVAPTDRLCLQHLPEKLPSEAGCHLGH